ncbi:hypothetical protein NT239_08405 [Chitinibacter sp. SCUT-21]|uniref:hypothetical protein n=1 Tax=Chitinibacter sp. SCUT-21 TaxID=2970891 RepID=UPI0035A6B749
MLSALSLPKTQQKNTNPRHRDANTLGDWLASLPLLNIQSSAAQVLDHLTQLNASELDPKNRYALLQHYQRVIGELARVIQPEQQADKKDLATSKREIGFLQALHLELLNGLKLCLCDFDTARFVLGRRPYVALLHDLMSAYLALMWTCYRAYAAFPESTWLQLHALFKFAVSKGIVDFAQQQAAADQRIWPLYQEALLLALVDPQAFSAVEQNQVRCIIQNNLAAVSLKKIQEVTSQRNGFLLLLDQDLPPTVSNQVLGPESGVVLWLETGALFNQLNRLIERIHQDSLRHGLKPDVPLAVWRRAARRFDSEASRSFERKHDSGHIEIVYGLRSACFYLNQQRPLVPPTEEGEVLSQAIVGRDFPLPQEWEISNVSPGGYALRLDLGEQHLPCRVGDLLLAREFSRPRWMLAAVRWQTIDLSAGSTEIGIEIISIAPEAALIKPTQNYHASYLHALALPEWKAKGSARMLIAPRASFGPMRELTLHQLNASAAIRASRLVEHSASYDLFEYFD